MVHTEIKETKETAHEIETVSFRLRCSGSGNGLSHYIMYGDVPEEARQQ
ncbi:MAG TPA: hypothetical protein VJL89_04200 [Thermodesulfovibrionia bacterium]|jgi:hypothetical protein|nr:hypothetical protein [Thermodesulfovibrionia bacterium]